MGDNPKKLVAELSQKLHRNQWALIPGTGVAIKDGSKVFVPPADVHLDRLVEEDIFTFNCELDKSGNPELCHEATNPALNISAYTNLFLKVFQEFDCGCIIFAQPTSAVLVGEHFEKNFSVKNNQMITQISNGETKEQYPWTHNLQVPIVKNPNDQNKLFAILEKAFESNPETNAVIVKGNGLFLCGDTWTETVTMFESLLYLFNLKLESMRLERPKEAPKPAPTPKVVRAPSPKAPSVISNGKPSSRPVEKSRPKPRPSILAKPYGVSRSSLISNTELLALRRKKLEMSRTRLAQRKAEWMGAPQARNTAASFMIGGDDGQMQMQQQQQQMLRQQQMQQQMRQQQAMMNQQMMVNQQQQQFNNMSGGNQNYDTIDRSNRLFKSLSGSAPYTGGRGRGGRGRGPIRGASRGGSRGSIKARLGFKSNISVDPLALKKGMNEMSVSSEDY